ncbi:MAG: DUF3276 family protein [Urechidicola sp.]|nr:DUF3276 family protein [Urechidicola sp.]
MCIRDRFNEMLKAATDYIINEKGEEVISDRHQTDYVKAETEDTKEEETVKSESFTDVNFEDI